MSAGRSSQNRSASREAEARALAEMASESRSSRFRRASPGLALDDEGNEVDDTRNSVRRDRGGSR